MTEPTRTTPIDPAIPRWPQFGMRSLFVFVTACCIIFALFGLLGRLWALAFGWMLLMTAVHVAANVWGTRLRHRNPAAAPRLDRAGLQHDVEPPVIVCAPATRLRERARLSWLRVAMSVLLAILGGTLGVGLLWLVGMDYGSLAIAGMSAAVLGGFLGFLASSFFEVALCAWWEAQKSYQGR